MAETKKTPYVGTRLVKDSNEAGSPILDESTGEWKSGHVLIELFDGKTGQIIDSYKKSVTRIGFAAWREEFATLTTDEIITQYFPGDPTNPVAPTVEEKKESDDAEALKVALAKIAELEAEKAANEDVEAAFAAQAKAELPVKEVEVKVDKPKAKKK